MKRYPLNILKKNLTISFNNKAKKLNENGITSQKCVCVCVLPHS